MNKVSVLLVAAIIAVVLIGLLVIVEYSINPFQSSVPGIQGRGITDITNRELSRNISLEEAINEAKSNFGSPESKNIRKISYIIGLGSNNESSPNDVAKFSTIPFESSHISSIRYIKGIGVDNEGSAHEWVIGLVTDNGNYFFTYGVQGQTLIKWNGSISDSDINTNSIISPVNLFKLEKTNIFGNTTSEGNFDIEIRGGKYYVTQTSGSIRKSYIFNAYSGELLSVSP